MQGKPKAIDIAYLAGVSQRRVSRALRGSPSVSPETRRRIETIAQQLSYKVDKNASNLRWDPMAPLTRSIAASRIEGLLRDKVPGLQAFTTPSNRLFVPREYEFVNCCICMCPEPINCDPL